MFVINDDNILEAYTGNDRNIVIPDGVIAIGSHAFSDNVFLESVSLPVSLKNIGFMSFSNCYNLKSARFNDACCDITIEDDAFYNCFSLTSINLDNVGHICEESFAHCLKLRNICISEATVVDAAAFLDCRLDHIDFSSRSDFSTIHDSTLLREAHRCILCHGAMEDRPEFGGMQCSICGQLHRYENMIEWDSFVIENQACVDYRGSGSHIPNGVKKIASRAFDDKTVSYLELYSSSIRTIEDEAFISCDFALPVSFPETLIRVGRKAFQSSNLTRLYLPDAVEIVGDGAFAFCEHLKNVDLGYVKIIGAKAFYQCTALPEIHIPDSITWLGPSAFQECASLAKAYLPKRFENQDLTLVFPEHTALFFEE